MNKESKQTVCSNIPLTEWKGTVTLFKGMTSTTPTNEIKEVAWEDIQSAICTEHATTSLKKNEGLYFIPCLLKEAPLVGNTFKTAEATGQPTIGKMRSKNHVTEASMLVMDIDGLPESLIKSVEEKLQEDQITYLVYSSYSNGNPQKPDARVRFVVPVDTAMSTDDYRKAYIGFDHHYFDGRITEKDPSGASLYQQQGTWMTHPDWQDKAYKSLHNAGIASADFLISVGQSTATFQTQAATEFNLEADHYPPSDANKVAERCKQIRIFRDSKGEGQSEPVWNDCIGLVVHCQNGPSLCQDWSSGHQDYGSKETQKKLEQRIKYGPTTCQQFKKNNLEHCLNCVETCKSPITLGYPEESSKPASSKPVTPAFIEEIEPWHEPVDPSVLVNTLVNLIRNHIVVTEEQALATALWIIMTWGTYSFDILPLLIISAPEKSCGKTQLVSIVGKTVSKNLSLSNITQAAMYRVIDKHQPTLVIDEVDTFIKENPELMGLINAGYSRSNAFVIRCVGDSHEPKAFPVWGPKALAGISLEKHLSEATMSRGILIDMRRKLPNEKVNRLRRTNKSVFKETRRKCARFMNDIQAKIATTQIELPDSLDDRQQDNWEPLLTIAACIGPEWLDKATQAALTLSENDEPAQSIGIELLSAFRTLFINRKTNRISTSDAVEILISDKEGPWASFDKSKPITPRQIAKELKRFKIKSRTSKFDGVTLKGYFKEDFEDAFTRYLPLVEAPIPGNLPLIRNSAQKPMEIMELSVTDTSATERVDIVTIPGIPLPTPSESCVTQLSVNSEAF